MRKRSRSIKVVGQVGQLRRYRVRLTKRENAAIKQLARRHDALPPKTLGVAYNIEMLKKVLEDVEIYVDEIYRQSPKKIIEEAVEVAVHEICHKEGLNEEQATIATDILMKDKKLKHSLAERTKRALKESKILGQLMTWRCPETRKKIRKGRRLGQRVHGAVPANDKRARHGVREEGPSPEGEGGEEADRCHLK